MSYLIYTTSDKQQQIIIERINKSYSDRSQYHTDIQFIFHNKMIIFIFIFIPLQIHSATKIHRIFRHEKTFNTDFKRKIPWGISFTNGH